MQSPLILLVNPANPGIRKTQGNDTPGVSLHCLVIICNDMLEFGMLCLLPWYVTAREHLRTKIFFINSIHGQLELLNLPQVQVVCKIFPLISSKVSRYNANMLFHERFALFCHTCIVRLSCEGYTAQKYYFKSQFQNSLDSIFHPKTPFHFIHDSFHTCTCILQGAKYESSIP